MEALVITIVALVVALAVIGILAVVYGERVQNWCDAQIKKTEDERQQ
jgi:type II secretory pathway pseudopilin PulG